MDFQIFGDVRRNPISEQSWAKFVELAEDAGAVATRFIHLDTRMRGENEHQWTGFVRISQRIIYSVRLTTAMDQEHVESVAIGFFRAAYDEGLITDEGRLNR